MSPNEFNDAFVNQMTGFLPTPPHDPRFIAHEMMQRDQWRTLFLAFFSLLFWLIGTAGMILLMIGLNQFVMYFRIVEYQPWNKSTAACSTYKKV